MCLNGFLCLLLPPNLLQNTGHLLHVDCLVGIFFLSTVSQFQQAGLNRTVPNVRRHQRTESRGGKTEQIIGKVFDRKELVSLDCGDAGGWGVGGGVMEQNPILRKNSRCLIAAWPA